MTSEIRISIVIPNYNNAATIGKCLEAAFSSDYGNFEIIVVDDHSEDNSVEIIRKFPCKLICLERHEGASRARNIGAQNSDGDVIFFTDADCLLQKDTLSIINRMLMASPPLTKGGQGGVAIGGTYTRVPYDRSFFSIFQSVFVHYSETKNIVNPDYIAAHAMIIDARTFRKSSGFPEKFLPIIEDVEFSHRLRRDGCRLIMNPEVQVQHIFNFNLIKSMKNAVRKTRYWAIYSLKNKDFFVDSGSASVELKTDVVSCLLSIFLFILWLFLRKTVFLYPLPMIFFINTYISRGLLKSFYETKGALFAILALMYYSGPYALAVGTGAIIGTRSYLLNRGNIT